MTSRLAAIIGALRSILFTLIAVFALVTAAFAVAPPGVAGIWTGTLQAYYCPGINCRPINLRLFLDVTDDSAGRLGASLDSVDQDAMGLRGDNIVFKSNAFGFDIPPVQGNYQGTLSADGKSFNGTWTQGIPLPMVFTRITAPAGVAGIWEGDFGSCPLRVVLHITADSAGKLKVSLDSVDDQDPMGLPGNNAVLKGDAFSFDNVRGNYQAIVSADGYLNGKWSDRQSENVEYLATAATNCQLLRVSAS